MSAGEYDFPELAQGETFRATLFYKPGGVPMDWTGCTARMQVRLRPTNPAVLELTTENGGIDLLPEGRMDLYKDEAETLSLAAATYEYDLFARFTNGDEKRILKGRLPIVPAITRAAP